MNCPHKSTPVAGTIGGRETQSDLPGQLDTSLIPIARSAQRLVWLRRRYRLDAQAAELRASYIFGGPTP